MSIKGMREGVESPRFLCVSPRVQKLPLSCCNLVRVECLLMIKPLMAVSVLLEI